MTLDILDEKILNILNLNPKIQYSQIAKKLNISKEVIAYRIKNLINKKIIKGFISELELGYLSYQICLSFSKINKTIIEKINSTLDNPNITMITLCGGNYDIIFTIMAKNPIEFDNLFQEIISPISEHISSYEISIKIFNIFFGYRTSQIKKIDFKFNLKTENKIEYILDEKDKKILKILFKNARTKLTQIGLNTKIPIDTIKYRIKKLEQIKIIKRYNMIIDYSKLNLNSYKILLRCNNLNQNIIQKFYLFVSNMNMVESFSKLSGNYEIEFNINTKNKRIIKRKNRFQKIN